MSFLRLVSYNTRLATHIPMIYIFKAQFAKEHTRQLHKTPNQISNALLTTTAHLFST